MSPYSWPNGKPPTSNEFARLLQNDRKIFGSKAEICRR